MERKKVRCCEQVHNGGRSVSFHQCTRMAVVNRGGKSYCNQHDPQTIAAKNKKWNDDYNAKRAEEKDIENEAERLSSLLGVEGSSDYNHFTRSIVRNLVISFEDAEKIIARLTGGK